MTLPKLDAEHLYLATLAGCHAIVCEREMLNAINVFPVQDGDTGDNMAATASAVIHHASLQPSIKQTLQSVADASLTGARGNSGMIFSQFFNALADGAAEEEHLDISTFSNLLSTAAERVRAAILNPVDGTMLTIMEHWSTHVESSVTEASCFKILLPSITPKLQQAVNQTTQTLAVLEAAGVVDAGALGFFHFVSGFSHFIANPSSLPDIQAIPKLSLAGHNSEEVCATARPCEGRYCTEAMLRSDQLNPDQLMNILKQYGESIVISANAHLCRFHLHTDKPWELFSVLRPLGRVYQPKVDDMLRQFQTLHERSHPIALVTDSNADLPKSYLDEHQIHVLPLNIHMDEHDLLDKYSISSEVFYKHLPLCQTHPKTSCPSPSVIEQKLKPLSEKYDQVLVLSLAQCLSGTHDAFKLIADNYPNIHVINSKHCSASQGLLLAEAAQAIANQTPIETIKAQIENQIPRTHFWFMVHDLNALIRSGRINKILGTMAQFSGIKPVFSLNAEGKAVLVSKAFSEQAGLQKILHAVQLHLEQGEKLKTYSIVHAAVPQEAKAFAKLCTQTFGMPPAYIEPVSVAIGVHAGPGCLGLAAVFEGFWVKKCLLSENQMRCPKFRGSCPGSCHLKLDNYPVLLVSIIIIPPFAVSLLSMKFPLVILLFSTMLLLGCNTTYKKPPLNEPSDDASIQLAEAAVSISDSMHEMAKVEKVISPPTRDNTLTIPNAYSLQTRASVDWSGPIEELTRRVAKTAHFKLHILGKAPAVPVLVSLTIKDETLAAILRDIDYQARNKASIHVYPRHRIVELRYAKFYS